MGDLLSAEPLPKYAGYESAGVGSGFNSTRIVQAGRRHRNGCRMFVGGDGVIPSDWSLSDYGAK
ncbi:MAG: hypothetical protein ACPGXX_12695 [Planctomycetaceae bacterium]